METQGHETEHQSLMKQALQLRIVKEGEVIATLNVESERPGAFDEGDVITLESVSAQVAVAITNRRMYREIKDFNLRLQQAVTEKTQELRQAHERILTQQKLLQ